MRSPRAPAFHGVTLGAAPPSPSSGATCRGPCGLRAQGSELRLHACRGPLAAAPALASHESVSLYFRLLGAARMLPLEITRVQATAAAPM
jgi:hypothetical protein